MPIIEKAKQVIASGNKAELEKFCEFLFDKGKDWLDVETLMEAAGWSYCGEIYEIYENWQVA